MTPTMRPTLPKHITRISDEVLEAVMADSRRDTSGGVGGRSGARKGADGLPVPAWVRRCRCRCRCTQGCVTALRRCTQGADGSAGVGAGDFAGTGGGARRVSVSVPTRLPGRALSYPATGAPCHTRRSTASSTSPRRSQQARPGGPLRERLSSLLRATGERAVTGLAASAATGRAGAGVAGREHGRRRDVLILTPTQPGGTATGRLLVANDGDAALAGLKLVCVGLVADGGRRIEGRALTTAPAALDLRARGHRLVDLTLRVPESTAPGTYTGVILAAGSPQIRSLVLVEVR